MTLWNARGSSLFLTMHRPHNDTVNEFFSVKWRTGKLPMSSPNHLAWTSYDNSRVRSAYNTSRCQTWGGEVPVKMKHEKPNRMKSSTLGWLKKPETDARGATKGTSRSQSQPNKGEAKLKKATQVGESATNEPTWRQRPRPRHSQMWSRASVSFSHTHIVYSILFVYLTFVMLDNRPCICFV